MVIFFDLDPSLEHGQVQLYAAPGFEATFLDNAAAPARSSTRTCSRTCSAATSTARCSSPWNASTRRRRPRTPDGSRPGRQINAVLGLILAPIVFLGLAGWAFFSWRRFGKDPVYLDDPSILMPAPPPET